jgi:methyl-accepting chemotaxis protein
MNFFNRMPLRRKLQLVPALLIGCSLLGSVLAFVEMRHAAVAAEDVALRQMPAIQALRNLRLGAVGAASALKSYLLFGSDSTAAARYRAEFEQYEGIAGKAIVDISALHGSFADPSDVDKAVAEYRAFDATNQKVEQLAFGQGNSATAQAYTLLQGDAASRYERLDTLLNQSVQQETRQSAVSLQEELRLNRLEAIFMWLGVILGGLAGIIVAESTGRRIVGVIVDLANRARAIAEGDLTGEPLHIPFEDEVGDLAASVNRMQQSLTSMVSTVKDASAAVHRDAEQLAGVANTSFTRTQEMSSQTHQAATAMQEMSISIAEVSNHAQTAADQARQASTTARDGGAIVEEMLTGMSSISESVSQTAETVQRLGHESEQIIRIVNVIEEIAQKTNLLALNAAIEAARAGEQGRGFAVVAGEVRHLAESTRNATSEIAQMIQGIQDHTHQAVQAMGSGTDRVRHGMEITARAGEALRQIISAANEVDAMIAQIATASTEQSVAAQEFSQNLEVINRLSEEHAAATPITRQYLDSVEGGAKHLQEHIGRFRIDSRQRPPQSPAGRYGMALDPAPSFGD